MTISVRMFTIAKLITANSNVGGIEEFSALRATRIWASGYDADFLSPENLDRSSLCEYMDVDTPKYSVSNWASDGQTVTNDSGAEVPLKVYQVPGHTPDQMAIWDSEERHLFVGDMAYLDAPILFLVGGSAVRYRESLTKLQRLVEKQNAWQQRRVKLSCGHNISDVDAGTLLDQLSQFLQRITRGEITAKTQGNGYGLHNLELYSADGERVSFLGPRSVFSELADLQASQNVS